MKNSMRESLCNTRFYFVSLLLVLLATLTSWMLFGKGISFSQEQAHPFWLNVFFVNFTFMGDAIFAICLSAFFIFYLKRKQQGMLLLCSFLLCEIMVQVLKNITGISGPTLFFEEGQYLFLTGYSLTDHNGFISGHTAIAFALVTALVLTIKSWKYQLILLAAALLLGYSRLYLAQHDLSAILFGIITGGFSAVIAFYMVYQFKTVGYRFKKTGALHTNVDGNMQAF